MIVGAPGCGHFLESPPDSGLRFVTIHAVEQNELLFIPPVVVIRLHGYVNHHFMARLHRLVGQILRVTVAWNH